MELKRKKKKKKSKKNKKSKKLSLKSKIILGSSGIAVSIFFFAIIIVAIMTLISGIVAAISGANSGNLSEYTDAAYGQAYDLSDNTQMFVAELYAACENYDVLHWFEVLKAIMEIESGGEGPEWADRMCCSESQQNYEYPRYPGAITSVAYSMDAGVRTWISLCEYTGLTDASQESLLLATVQCYNFGPGFWDYLISDESKYYGEFAPIAAETYQQYYRDKYGWTPGNAEYTDRFREHYKFPRELSFDTGGGGIISGAFDGTIGWPIEFTTCTTYSDHLAVDIGTGTTGYPVYAVGDGVVIWTYSFPNNIWGSGIDDERSWGNYVRIYYPGLGIQTGYAHLSTINVTQGQTVHAGQVVAYSGNSGNSSAPHLHYEIYEYSGYEVAPRSTRLDASEFRKYYPDIVIN